MVSGFLDIEILRGKNYPQTEDEPIPCTTQVNVELADASSGARCSIPQSSSIQEKSNAPFYNDTLRFRVETDEILSFLITVTEHARKKEPYTLFHGKQLVDLSKLKAKQRFVILLFSGGEEQPQNEVDAESLNIEESETAPFLSTRIQFTKDKLQDATDPYRDVEISLESLTFDGTNQIVPEGNQYVWLRLKSDKKWTGFYQYELFVIWRSHAPLEAEAQSTKKPKKGPTGGTGANAAGDNGIRTLGDLITKKWCCHRTHQVLTRVCLTAEKYGKKDADLTFTPKEEVVFRTKKKERSVLLKQICQTRLEDANGSHLRDWLNRLWFLFVTGIDNDPSGARMLSYEVRKTVHDAQFTEADAIILEACLLFSFIPSLKYETCQTLVESDHQVTLWEKEKESAAAAEGFESRVTRAQHQFTHVFILMVGSLLDTLTEAEVVKAAAEFKPAIWDAHQRIAKGAKNSIVFKRQDGSPTFKDTGINIDHLDPLGHRKKAPQFA